MLNLVYMQVTPQNIDQILNSVYKQRDMVEDRMDVLQDIKEELAKGNLIAAATIWVDSQIDLVHMDLETVTTNIDALIEAKQKMASGLIIPTGLSNSVLK